MNFKKATTSPLTDYISHPKDLTLNFVVFFLRIARMPLNSRGEIIVL